MDLKTLQKKKPKRFEAQKRLLPRVQKRFPAAFPPPNKAAQPLKLGINEDLLARLDLDAFEGILSDPKNPQMRRQVIEDMLGAYTSTTRYLRSVVLKSKRVDLDGNVFHYVKKSHRRHAREKLQARGIDPKSRDAYKAKPKRNDGPKTKTNKSANGKAAEDAPAKPVAPPTAAAARAPGVRVERRRNGAIRPDPATTGSTDAGASHTSPRKRGTLKLNI